MKSSRFIVGEPTPEEEKRALEERRPVNVTDPIEAFEAPRPGRCGHQISPTWFCYTKTLPGYDRCTSHGGKNYSAQDTGDSGLNEAIKDAIRSRLATSRRTNQIKVALNNGRVSWVAPIDAMELIISGQARFAED